MIEDAQKQKTVYMRAEKCSRVSHRQIAAEDVAEFFSNDKELERQVKKQVFFTVSDERETKYVFSVLKLMELLGSTYKNVDWVNIGEEEFIVEYKPEKPVSTLWEILKTSFVCLAVFFGSAFTIMTFNQDVAVADVFRTMEDLVLGVGEESKAIEIAYAIGLPAGIILFFNHFSRFKIDSDPTPLQVQMRMYEENVNKTVVENVSREGRLKEVK